jgi:hypothetical protein
MSEGPIECSQDSCDSDAFVRYTWPGKDESFACVICAIKVQSIAAHIDLPLQMIPLTIDDYTRAAAGKREAKR